MVQIMRSRWLVLTVHLGIWLLLYLSVAGLSGNTPRFREADGSQPAVRNPAAVDKFAALFSAAAERGIFPATNTMSPFFTRHFIPSPAPPPAAPTTRKVELTYQGYYVLSENGARQAILKLADSFVVTPVGAKVTANLYVADAGMQMLILTNPAAQTNLLPLNLKKELEVPIQ